MQESEIIEGNSLLKEFMEIDVFTYDSWKHDQLTEGKYHLYWDWLMPVVEKISKLNEYTDIVIYSHICYINYGKNNPFDNKRYKVDFHRWEGLSQLEMVYLAIIQFLKWYNENK